MDGSMALAKADEELLNSLSQLCGDLALNGGPLAGLGSIGNELSQTDTLFFNNRWYLISNNRNLLSQVYVEHGIVQTLVDQPVDDAFRAGYELKTKNLSADDIEQLKIYDDRVGLTRALMGACKWARLFGGGAVLIITGQPPEEPLNLDEIKEDSPLEFRAVDMWELYFTNQNVTANTTVGGSIGANMGEYYNYYGKRIHKSRVYRVEGKEAPSFIRPRLRGWGMSELERLVRSLNQYMKNQDVIFELLDEAKIDVYKIKGFNNALLKAEGTTGIQRRIQLGNQIKNYNDGIVMDTEDDYLQKQIAFSGLAEVLVQIRQGICADLKMPVTKVFGISAAGFNSGEDDIENYNSMVDGEIRQKVRFKHVDLLQIACCKVFGAPVPDLMLEYNPLRILNAKEEEEVKDSQFNRVMSTYQSGLVADVAEIKEAINKDSLLPIELDVNAEAGMPIGGDFSVEGEAKGKGGTQAKTEA